MRKDLKAESVIAPSYKSGRMSGHDVKPTVVAEIVIFSAGQTVDIELQESALPRLRM